MSSYQKYDRALLVVEKATSSGGVYSSVRAASVAFSHTMDLSSGGTLLASAASCTLTFSWEVGSEPPGTLPTLGDVIRVKYGALVVFLGRVRDRSFSQEPNPARRTNPILVSWTVTCGDSWTEAMIKSVLHPKGLPRERAYNRLGRYVAVIGGFTPTATNNPYVGEEARGYRTNIADQVRAFSEASGVVCRVVGSEAVRLRPLAAVLPPTVLATEGDQMYSGYSQQVAGGQNIASFDPQDWVETGTITLKANDVRLLVKDFSAGDWLPTLSGTKIGQVSSYQWVATPKSFTSSAEIKFGAGRPQASIPSAPREAIEVGVRGPAGTYSTGSVVRGPDGELYSSQGTTDLPPQKPLGGVNNGVGPWPLHGATLAVVPPTSGLYLASFPPSALSPQASIDQDFESQGNVPLTPFPVDVCHAQFSSVSRSFTLDGVMFAGITVTVTALTPGYKLYLMCKATRVDRNGVSEVVGLGGMGPTVETAAVIGANGVYTFGPLVGPNAPYIDNPSGGIRDIVFASVHTSFIDDIVYRAPGNQVAGTPVPPARVRLLSSAAYGTVSTGATSVLASFALEENSPGSASVLLDGSVIFQPYFGPKGLFSGTTFNQTLTTLPTSANIGGPTGQYLHHVDVYFVPTTGKKRYIGTYRPVTGPVDSPARIAKNVEWGQPWDVDGTNTLVRLGKPTIESGSLRVAVTAVSRPLTGSETVTITPCHEDARTVVAGDGAYSGAATVTAASPQDGAVLFPLYNSDNFPEDKYFVRASWTNAAGVAGATTLIGPPYNDRPGDQPSEWTPLTGP